MYHAKFDSSFVGTSSLRTVKSRPCDGPVVLRGCSSTRQSSGLLIRRLQVRFLLPPPSRSCYREHQLDRLEVCGVGQRRSVTLSVEHIIVYGLFPERLGWVQPRTLNRGYGAGLIRTTAS